MMGNFAVGVKPQWELKEVGSGGREVRIDRSRVLHVIDEWRPYECSNERSRSS
jgi:hypothetical protein